MAHTELAHTFQFDLKKEAERDLIITWMYRLVGVVFCQVYTAVNTLRVSAELLVETYLPFHAVTNCTTHSELQLPHEAHESDG